MDKFEDLIDEQKLRTRLISVPSKTTISEWHNTALEVCGDKYSEVCSVYQIYMEMSEDELNIDRLLLYIKNVITIMPTLEDKKRLIRAEALGERLFNT
jgi:hypothetical protein